MAAPSTARRPRRGRARPRSVAARHGRRSPRRVSRRHLRPRSALRPGRGARLARRAAGRLSACHLGAALAGVPPGRARYPLGARALARAWRALPALLDRAGVARGRVRGHQAAAVRLCRCCRRSRCSPRPRRATASLPRRGWRSSALALWAFVGLALVVAVASLPGTSAAAPAWPRRVTAAVVVALIGFLVLRRRREGVAGMTPALVLMSLVLQAGAFQWVLPRVDALWPSRAVARAVRAARGCPEAWSPRPDTASPAWSSSSAKRRASPTPKAPRRTCSPTRAARWRWSRRTQRQAVPRCAGRLREPPRCCAPRFRRSVIAKGERLDLELSRWRRRRSE